jgi:hypothetical protein
LCQNDVSDLLDAADRAKNFDCHYFCEARVGVTRHISEVGRVHARIYLSPLEKSGNTASSPNAFSSSL